VKKFARWSAVFFSVLASAALAAPGAETRIPSADHGGIYNWQVLDNVPGRNDRATEGGQDQKAGRGSDATREPAGLVETPGAASVFGDRRAFVALQRGKS
jgi:hypothetical protein